MRFRNWHIKNAFIVFSADASGSKQFYTDATDGSDEMCYIVSAYAQQMIDFKQQNGNDAFVKIMKNYRI